MLDESLSTLDDVQPACEAPHVSPVTTAEGDRGPKPMDGITVEQPELDDLLVDASMLDSPDMT